MQENRINLSMTIIEAVMAMAEGNPGAVTVLGTMIKNNMDEGIVDMCHLDDMHIYGSEIWVCWKDVCNENYSTFIEKVRARTLVNDLVKFRLEHGYV